MSFYPILDAVNKAMADVAKKQGMMYVFDTGSSVLLYADESLDVTTWWREVQFFKASKVVLFSIFDLFDFRFRVDLKFWLKNASRQTFI